MFEDEYCHPSRNKRQPVDVNPDGIKFAVVGLNSNNKTFTTWHDTLESAKTEAERLARQVRQPFAVIQLVGVMRPSEIPVEWKEF
jgi:hypothetical protein